MDSEAIIAAHRGQWDRLEELTLKRRLSGAEADELIVAYRNAADDLSHLSTGTTDSDRVAQLSVLLVRARTRFTSSQGPRFSFARFFLVTLPVVLYRLRWWALTTTVASLLVAVITGWWIVQNPVLYSYMGSPEILHEYANEAFEAYYSNHAAPAFAAQVWTHNAFLSAICFAGGITGVVPVFLLIANSINLGVAGAVLYAYGDIWLFFALILPHGILEMSTVFLAAAAGLKLFWTVFVPGNRPRLQALASEGRSLFISVVATTIMLFISGIFEGFLTPSSLPVWLKIVIGGGTTILIWVYAILLGRAAVARGETGDLSELQAGYIAKVVG